MKNFTQVVWKHIQVFTSLRVFVVVQSLNRAWHFLTPWTVAWQTSLSFTISQSLLKLMSMYSMTPSDYFILCYPFFSCPQFLVASGSFPMSWLFVPGDQSTGASALALVIPMNFQGWFPLELTDLISLQCKGLSTVFSSIIVQKHRFFSGQPSLWSSSHNHTWLLQKP